MHAYACIGMVENDKKCSKISYFYVSLTQASWTHDEKSMFAGQNTQQTMTMMKISSSLMTLPLALAVLLVNPSSNRSKRKTK